MIGNELLERTGSGATSIGSSGVLVSRPGDVARGWDWRVGLPEAIKGEDVLRSLRLGLARGLSLGALGGCLG